MPETFRSPDRSHLRCIAQSRVLLDCNAAETASSTLDIVDNRRAEYPSQKARLSRIPSRPAAEMTETRPIRAPIVRPIRRSQRACLGGRSLVVRTNCPTTPIFEAAPIGVNCGDHVRLGASWNQEDSCHLQNLDIRAGSIHPRPDPPDAGTEHLVAQVALVGNSARPLRYQWSPVLRGNPGRDALRKRRLVPQAPVSTAGDPL